MTGKVQTTACLLSCYKGRELLYSLLPLHDKGDNPQLIKVAQLQEMKINMVAYVRIK